MIVKIKFLGQIKGVELKEGSTISDALKKAGINPETVIVSRMGEIVPESEKTKEGETIEAIRIVSGG